MSSDYDIDLKIEVALLVEIISDLQRFIDEYYFPKQGTPDFYKVTPLIPGRYHDESINAWKECRTNFNNLIDKLNSPDLKEEDLVHNGLAMAQLRFKYKICKESLGQAKDWYTYETMDERPKRKSWYKKWGGYCKNFFQSSNIVIGSLSNILSLKSYAEPIKEIVEGISFVTEKVMDYRDRKK
jgi:hypothetical protein